MSHPLFGTSLRRDPQQPWDLAARIQGEMAERIEEAVDFACLDAMVESRRARGLAAPAAGRPQDREEFNASVLAFLQRLRGDLLPRLDGARSRAVEQAAARAGGDRLRQLIAEQVALAQALPDYWHRFETLRADYRAGVLVSAARTPSRGERRGLRGRLFGG